MSDAAPFLPKAPDEPAAMRPKLRWGPWATLAWGIGATAIMVATQTFGALAYVLWQRAAYPGQTVRVEDLLSNGPALTVAFLISAPFLIGFIGIAVKLSRQNFREYLGLTWPSGRDVAMGVVTVAGVLALSGAGATLLGQEAPAFATDTFDSAAKAGLIPLYGFAFAVLAPVQEELLFRGFLYRGFMPAIGPIPAIVALSAGWAMFHVQYAWFFVGEIFLLGLAFGWLRWRSGSLFLTIGLHMAVNSLAMLAAAFGD